MLPHIKKHQHHYYYFDGYTSLLHQKTIQTFEKYWYNISLQNEHNMELDSQVTCKKLVKF